MLFHACSLHRVSGVPDKDAAECCTNINFQGGWCLNEVSAAYLCHGGQSVTSYGSALSIPMWFRRAKSPPFYPSPYVIKKFNSTTLPSVSSQETEALDSCKGLLSKNFTLWSENSTQMGQKTSYFWCIWWCIWWLMHFTVISAKGAAKSFSLPFFTVPQPNLFIRPIWTPRL